MILLVAGLLLAVAIGFVITRTLVRDVAIDLLLGLSILLGLGTQGFLLLILGVTRIEWSIVSLAAANLVLMLAVIPFYRRQERRRVEIPALDIAIVFEVATLVLLVGYWLAATAGPLSESDFLAIWGVKGRLFFEHRGIHFGFLTNPVNVFTHPDYPVLVPMMFDFIALLLGQWDDALIAIIYPLLALGLLLVFRAELRRSGAAAILRGVALLAPACLIFAPWLGLADGPLVAYVAAALLLMRREEARMDAVAGLLFGFACAIKNEGLTYSLSALIAVALFRRRAVLRMWPVVVVPLPWLVTRAVIQLKTVLWSGPVMDRVAQHVEAWRLMLDTAATVYLGRPLFWIAIAAALLLAMTRLANERIVIATIAMQGCFYVAAYLATSYDVVWHLRWSLDRVVYHLLVPATLTLILVLLQQEEEPDVAPDASNQQSS